ncbi:hypothetical protein [Desulfosporosinus sp. BG]|uniref:hypothetical protein n=1 Tax=Desulfosporosinus sp. BG TaxID=1633135 RepID=UPI00159F2A7F|nr:hypothetical protein [Desulfosporosinus sp. BG]
MVSYKLATIGFIAYLDGLTISFPLYLRNVQPSMLGSEKAFEVHLKGLLFLRSMGRNCLAPPTVTAIQIRHRWRI